MAQKRKVDQHGPEPPPREAVEEPDQGDLPRWLQEQSWSQWLRGPFASRFYALFCFAFDAFLGLELARRFGDQAWAVLPILALLVAGEVTVYLYLWGSGGKMW